jgi:hypothetical protein
MAPATRRPLLAVVAGLVVVALLAAAILVVPGVVGPARIAGRSQLPGATADGSAGGGPFAVPASPPPAGAVVSADVVVYGATPSGIVAAVSAARLGASVVLVTPEAQVGGMMTSGLSHADVGRPALIGGLTRAVFEQIADDESRTGAPPTYGWSYEPHVAARVFERLLRDAHVVVYLGMALDRTSAPDVEGGRIVELRMTNGTRLRGNVFIDASYEGDLMAAADVPFTVGRESEAAYGESLAGVHLNGTQVPASALAFGIDANGDPLPGVDPGPIQPGAADDLVQAATYRLCVTRIPTNRIPFSEPADYDPSAYALVGRAIQADRTAGGVAPTLAEFVALERLPDGKFDLNSSGLYSTDLVGAAGDWASADDATRLAIAAQHRSWVSGLLWYLETDPAVPATLRRATAQLGLCADEFRSSGGWPPELYVREARRMVGSVILTQHDLQEHPTKADAIALGTYRIDAHYVRRILGGDDRVRGDGQLSGETVPYQIPYAAIVPPSGSVDNLLVSVTISASHVAWSSIRTEPTLMELGEAAGVAAGLAVRGGIGVREVGPEAIRAVLLQRGAILAVPPGGPILTLHPAAGRPSASGSSAPSVPSVPSVPSAPSGRRRLTARRARAVRAAT